MRFRSSSLGKVDSMLNKNDVGLKGRIDFGMLIAGRGSDLSRRGARHWRLTLRTADWLLRTARAGRARGMRRWTGALLGSWIGFERRSAWRCCIGMASQAEQP